MGEYMNNELDNMVSSYYNSAAADFEFDSSSDTDDALVHHDDDDDFFSFEQSKPKTDTSATEARNGKDIQGIPWERLNFSRDNYRETRLNQYINYESLSLPRGDLEKDFNKVEKGHSFYDFQFNTRLVKSTIVHFQLWSIKSTKSILKLDLVRYAPLRTYLYTLAQGGAYILLNYLDELHFP